MNRFTQRKTLNPWFETSSLKQNKSIPNWGTTVILLQIRNPENLFKVALFRCSSIVMIYVLGEGQGRGLQRGLTLFPSRSEGKSAQTRLRNSE